MITIAASFILVFVLYAAAYAQTSPRKDFPGIKISNFGQMDERFYRGGRPKEGKGQFEALKALGIKTVIDLSDDPRAWEKREAEAAGLTYVYMPIVDKAYPTEQNIADFFKLIDDPATGAFFVHCGGGRHRTGMAGFVYRVQKYGWGFEQAYKEMKNYDFYSSWGHGKQKDFVKDFAAKAEAERASAKTATAETSAAPAISQ